MVNKRYRRSCSEVAQARGFALGLTLLLIAPGAAAAQQSPDAAQSAVELGRLHDALRLSPAQETAWHAYTVAVAANSQTDARRRVAEDMMPTLSTPRRIMLMESALAADEVDLRREGAAVIAFYGQLTPGQQQTFDRETLPQNPRGGRGS